MGIFVPYPFQCRRNSKTYTSLSYLSPLKYPLGEENFSKMLWACTEIGVFSKAGKRITFSLGFLFPHQKEYKEVWKKRKEKNF